MLTRTLRRLAEDYRVQWGQPVVAVETFVDSSTHRGTCYVAGGFELLGRTAGYGRSGDRWFHHGNTKLVLMCTLRRDARRLLSAPTPADFEARPGTTQPAHVANNPALPARNRFFGPTQPNAHATTTRHTPA